MCWPYVLTSTSIFSATKDSSKEDGVCSFRNRFSTKPRKHNSSLEVNRYSFVQDSLRLMVSPKVLMVVRTISHRNTLHTVTNDFFMILFNTNLPSEFTPSLAYMITLFTAFSFFPIRATWADGLTPWHSHRSCVWRRPQSMKPFAITFSLFCHFLSPC
jgi:hypothetical protein